MYLNISSRAARVVSANRRCATSLAHFVKNTSSDKGPARAEEDVCSVKKECLPQYFCSQFYSPHTGKGKKGLL
jgi:hypothetical protein